MTTIQFETDHLLNTGAYQIQLTIEDLKAALKHVVDGMCKGGISEENAIRGLESARRELEVFEYMMALLDQDVNETKTVKKVEEWLSKAKDRGIY